MTDEQANEMLENNDWAKWSDARDLLQDAANVGGRNTAKSIAEWLDSQGHADLAKTVRQRWA